MISSHMISLIRAQDKLFLNLPLSLYLHITAIYLRKDNYFFFLGNCYLHKMFILIVHLSFLVTQFKRRIENEYNYPSKAVEAFCF